jgi:hypothetical protein
MAIHIVILLLGIQSPLGNAIEIDRAKRLTFELEDKMAKEMQKMKMSQCYISVV